MAPIPHDYHELPSNEKSNLHDESPNPRPRRVSPKALILGTILFLLTLGLLHKPIGHCYHRVREHVCHPRTIEQRARKVLLSAPLIGQYRSY